MTDDSKRSALDEKELGNAAYKKRDFEKALQHYHKAVELNPDEITFYLNIAAVLYEEKKYEDCIAQCEKAVEIGRENRADYKLIAKAFTRIANCHKQMKNYKTAKTFFEKSLAEHRTPDTKQQLSEIERLLKEQERLQYINPELAEEEKQKGNESFQKGDYASAVKHYSEAIRRNPDDPKLYSNRAAAYTKLAAFEYGLNDCDECIKLDSKFIKGYLRKANILKGLKQYSQAMDAYHKAMDIDPNCSEAIEGYKQCVLESEADPEEVRRRAMANPEVQNILKDPAMRLILEQMQNEPKALQDHLKNPEIAAKIQKLLEAGLIAIR